MTESLKKNLHFHATLVGKIFDKNCEILYLIKKKEIDLIMDCINEKESMQRVVNSIQNSIGRTMTELNGYPSGLLIKWSRSVASLTERCHKDDIKIISELENLQTSVKEEISRIHRGRVKMRGYVLGNLSN